MDIRLKHIPNVRILQCMITCEFEMRMCLSKWFYCGVVVFFNQTKTFNLFSFTRPVNIQYAAQLGKVHITISVNSAANIEFRGHYWEGIKNNNTSDKYHMEQV